MLLELPFTLQASGKRADTLHIKSQLADILSHADGARYWSALGGLLTGKTTRQEFEDETRRLFGKHERVKEICTLHNTLLLAILFNTTAQSSAPTSRHSGWFPKRKRRDGADGVQEEEDGEVSGAAAKKRKLKHEIMAFTRKERNRLLKLPSSNGEKPRKQLFYEQAAKNQIGFNGATPSIPGAGPGSSSQILQQDFAKCQQAPLCAEMLCLPDEQTMRDRMSWVAYNSKITGGAENTAASLLQRALEQHLTNILEAALEVKTSANESPLDLGDLANLFEVRPAIMVHPRIGAVEKALVRSHAEYQKSPPAKITELPSEVKSPVPPKATKPALAIAVPPPNLNAPGLPTSLLTNGEIPPKTGYRPSPTRNEQEEETLRQIQAAVLSAPLPKTATKNKQTLVLNTPRVEEAAPDKKKRRDWDVDVNALFAGI